MADIYTLYSCDAWAGRDSMRPLGVTSDSSMLACMIGARIKAGDMEYDGSGEDAWHSFLQDAKDNKIVLDKLKYGFVDTKPDMQIDNAQSYEAYPEIADTYMEITGLKAKSDIDKLGLNNRSLVYSEVEVRTDFGCESFLVPGMCDRDDLESSDAFVGFMEGTTDAEVNASVTTYSVGMGESVYPDESELQILSQYAEEIDKEYGIDRIGCDFINFYYEAEPEYLND